MKSRTFCFTLISTIAISIVSNAPATAAQRARVFVSVNGDDANPCTGGSPCKTFQHAHDVVAAGGEISVLDTGGYGTLLITKSLSIVAIGVEASIAVPSSVIGIQISAGSTDIVSLRGLTLDGTGIGGAGIAFETGRSLTVEDCVVRGMTNNGLQFVSGVTTAQTLNVSNSSFRDNLNGMEIGALSSGLVTASIDRTSFNRNADDGLFVGGALGTGSITVAVTDSVAADNGQRGFNVTSATGHSVSNLSVTHSQVANNLEGVLAFGANATLWLAQSTVTGNVAGFDANNGGIIKSYGDNYLQAANENNNGTLSPATKQ